LSRAAQRITSPAECAALADAGGAREFGLAAGGECWHCAGCSFDKFGRVPDAQQPTLCDPLGNEAVFQLHVREPASCKRRRVVVFAGELRGDGVTWLHLREALVANNDLDVIFDVWQAHAALELLAQELFKPCDWFSEPYEGDWKQREVARQPRFTLSNNGQLYALSPRRRQPGCETLVRHRRASAAGLALPATRQPAVERAGQQRLRPHGVVRHRLGGRRGGATVSVHVE